MVTLEWSLERNEGVTLVGLVVAAERPCRVRIENRLDGPVWPPRRHGQPADGWDDGAFDGHVPADGRLALGYASPAPPAEPPAAVVETEPADEGDDAGEVEAVTEGRPVPAVDSSPAGVVRALGSPVVPRDSVPVPDGDATRPGGDDVRSDGDGPRPDGRPTRAEARSEPDPDPASRGGTPEASRGRAERDPETAHRLTVPGHVRRWLRDVEDRLDAADRAPAGGLEGPATGPPLAAARAADRGALRRVRRRADELLARADQERGDGGEQSGGAPGERPDADAADAGER